MGQGRSRLRDGVGHAYGTRGRSRLWDGEDSFVGQKWSDCSRWLDRHTGPVNGTELGWLGF